MRWTLRRKILSGYGLVLMLLMVVLGWALLNLTQLGQASDDILSENYRSILAANTMLGALERQDSGVLIYLLGDEAEGIAQFQTNRAPFERWLARAEDNITIEGEADILNQIGQAYEAYVAAFTATMRAENPPPTAREELQAAFVEVRAACESLRTLNQDTMEAASERTQTVAQQAIWSVGGIGLAALGIGLVFSLLLSKRIVRPVQALQQASQSLAEGDYEARVSEKRGDELGALAKQFNAMADHLQSFQDMNVERLIAETRKNEAILQHMADGLVIVDAEARITHINPVAEKALGCRDRNAHGKPLANLIDAPSLCEALTPPYPPPNDKTGAEANDEHVLTRTVDDKTRYYEYVITPIEGPDTQAMVLLRDVTHFKEVDRLKSEFVATASHELKTPLTSIAMSINLLLESTESAFSEDDLELLEAARDDTERLRTLTQDLLNLSTLEAGGALQVDRQPVPVRRLIDKTVQVMHPQAREASIELVDAVPDALPAVQADPTKIAWVLTNLVSNALRYTEEGGTVRLRAEQIGDKVHLSVADNGAGIPYEYQARIFEKFTQVPNDPQTGGSGLGLAIGREVVRAHGGSIWVDSTPDVGSTFTFTLPCATSEQ